MNEKARLEEDVKNWQGLADNESFSDNFRGWVTRVKLKKAEDRLKAVKTADLKNVKDKVN